MKHLYHVCGDMSEYTVTVRAKSARKALKLARQSNRFKSSDRLAALELSVSGPSVVLDDFPMNEAVYEKLLIGGVHEVVGQLLWRGRSLVSVED